MRLLWILLLAVPATAQQCQVVGWDTQSYSQSAHIIRDEVVYDLSTSAGDLKITRREKKVELQSGAVDCRVEDKNVFIPINGKEKKFQVIGQKHGNPSLLTRPLQP